MKTLQTTDLACHALEEIVRALKTLRIYPADHPVRSQFIEPAFQALTALLNEKSPYTFRVRKNSIIVEDEILSDSIPFISDMAGQLSSLFISSLAFEQGLRQDELNTFLRLMSESPIDADLISHADDWLALHGVEHILVNQEELSSSNGIGTKAKMTPIVDEAFCGGAGELFTVLDKENRAPKEESLILNCFAQEPEKIAEIFKTYIESRGADVNTPEPGGDLVYKVVKEVYKCLRRLPHMSQKDYLHRITRAIMLLEKNTRNALVLMHLIENLHEDDVAMEIVRQVSDSELVDLIVAKVAVTDENAQGQIAGLKDLITAECHREQLIFMLEQHQNLEFVPHLSSDLIVGLKQIFDEARLCLISETSTLKTALSPQEISAKILSLNLQDYEELTYEADKYFNEASISDQYAQVLIRALLKSTESVSAGKLAEAVERFLAEMTVKMRILEMPEYLELLSPDGQMQDEIDVPLTAIEQIKQSLATTNNINNIVSWLVQHQGHDELGERIMSVLGKQAVESAIESLKTETDMGRRRKLCSILSVIGINHLDAIKANLKDERWYLVRNLTMILGQIRNPQAMEILLTLIKHPNEKVRGEVIVALSNFRELQAVKGLVSFIKDPSMDLRIKAVRRLGSSKEKISIRPLLEILNKNDILCHTCELKLAAIEALGKLGFSESIPILKSYAKSLPLVAMSKKRRLKSAAKQSLRTIGMANMRVAVKDDVYA